MVYLVIFVVAATCVFVMATKLEERRPTAWDDNAPVEGEEEKKPPSLLERMRSWWNLDRILAAMVLVACLVLGVRDGDATLPIMMGILLVPGMVLGL